MNVAPINIKVLENDIAFKPGADMERARRAARYVEDMYEAQRQRSEGSQGKDLLLTILALGLADELLQMKTRQAQLQQRLENLLEKIEKSL